MAGVDGLGDGRREPVVGRRRRVHRGASRRTTSDSDAAYDTVEPLRDAVHAVDGADALVGGDVGDLPRRPRAAARDNLVIIPLILLVVLLILCCCCGRSLAPLILIATVVLSFGAALGISALLFEYVFGFAGVRHARSRCSSSCSWSRWASTTTSS